MESVYFSLSILHTLYDFLKFYSRKYNFCLFPPFRSYIYSHQGKKTQNAKQNFKLLTQRTEAFYLQYSPKYGNIL